MYSKTTIIRRADIGLVVQGGTAERVIDLANPGGQPTEVLTPIEVRGRLLVGHTSDRADSDAPILIPEDQIVQRGDSHLAILTCRTCDARHQLGLLGPDTLALVEHQPGCPEMAQLLARAAAR